MLGTGLRLGLCVSSTRVAGKIASEAIAHLMLADVGTALEADRDGAASGLGAVCLAA